MVDLNLEEINNRDDTFPLWNDPLRELKQIDEQLAFLVLLTLEGIKPLSRWEKTLTTEQMELLKRYGLHVTQIRRTVLTGREVIETVFSKTQGYIEVYKARWDGSPIDKSPETVRFEGFLFGYPPCCVEAYIQNTYAPNTTNPEQQKHLFHWTCKNCKITPLMLPMYQRIYTFIENG
jgi:hypothetical protein